MKENTDFYNWECPSRIFSSPYAVNYDPSQRLWFVSHGFKLNYVDEDSIKILKLTKVLEPPKEFEGAPIL